jgi:phage shock protein C
MRSGSSTSTLVTDPNRISLLHRYGDLDLPRYGQNLSQDAQIRSPRPTEPGVGGPGSLRSIDSPPRSPQPHESSACPAGTLTKGGSMAQTRRLYCSRTNRKLAGVCGGLAQYFNTEATLIRILFVVLALLGGPGLVIYLVMWIIVPVEP